MAAAITLIKDEIHIKEDWNSKIRQITYLVSGDGLTATGPTITRVTGTLLAVKSAPLSTAKPDDNYDLTLVDATGSDLLQSTMVDCDETLTAYRCPADTNGNTIFLLEETVILKVSGFKTTGSASATVNIYIQLP